MPADAFSRNHRPSPRVKKEAKKAREEEQHRRDVDQEQSSHNHPEESEDAGLSFVAATDAMEADLQRTREANNAENNHVMKNKVIEEEELNRQYKHRTRAFIPSLCLFPSFNAILRCLFSNQIYLCQLRRSEIEQLFRLQFSFSLFSFSVFIFFYFFIFLF